MMSEMTLIPLPQTAPEPAPLAAFDARALTGPRGLAHLVLDDQCYTLRITRAGKLILTK
jgi:hemin uptake protein HemP